jgi:hypothetical protein
MVGNVPGGILFMFGTLDASSKERRR